MKRLTYIAVVMALMSLPCAGLGVSPSKITFEDMIQGQSDDKRLAISSSATQDIQVSINLNFPGNWLSIVTPENETITESGTFTLRAKSQSIFNVGVQLPEIGAGSYTGNIEIIYDPEIPVTNGSVSRIITRFVVPVEVIVTNQPNPRYRVIGMSVSDVKERKDVNILITMVNEGNVGAKANVVAQIVDKAGDVVKTVRDDVQLPRERGDQTHAIRVLSEGLEPGIYTARVTTKLGDEEVSDDSKMFGIIDEGVLSTIYATSTIPKTTTTIEVAKPAPPNQWKFIVAGFIIVALVLVYMQYKRIKATEAK